jgi:hypothetical protein
MKRKIEKKRTEETNSIYNKQQTTTHRLIINNNALLALAFLIILKKRASFVLGDLQHFYLLSSSFLPSVLSKWCMMGSYLSVLPVFLTLHSFNVTLFPLGLRLFLILFHIN